MSATLTSLLGSWPLLILERCPSSVSGLTSQNPSPSPNAGVRAASCPRRLAVADAHSRKHVIGGTPRIVVSAYQEYEPSVVTDGSILTAE
jgi:hypothetical protein